MVKFRVKVRVRSRVKIRVRITVTVSVSYIMTIWKSEKFSRCDKFPTTPDSNPNKAFEKMWSPQAYIYPTSQFSFRGFRLQTPPGLRLWKYLSAKPLTFIQRRLWFVNSEQK